MLTGISQSKGLRTRVVGPTLLRGLNSLSIPLPLPKEKVTVVLMNFSRPRMIRESKMMRTLLKYPNVDEFLLLHSNPDTVFEFVHPKVVNIDAIEQNQEMGVSLRFYFCQVAKNPFVMHLYDDMEFTTEVLNELFIEYSQNPCRIVGCFGRDLTPGNSFDGYNSNSRHKSTEVVMAVERHACSAFFAYAHLIWNDVVLHEGEGPLWNGEDIFMSLVANHIYGEPEDGRKFNKNYAMDWLNEWQADDALKDYSNGKLDISGGMKGYLIWDWRWWQTVLRRNRHYSYRGPRHAVVDSAQAPPGVVVMPTWKCLNSTSVGVATLSTLEYQHQILFFISTKKRLVLDSGIFVTTSTALRLVACSMLIDIFFKT
jgi:hypothetical protein